MTGGGQPVPHPRTLSAFSRPRCGSSPLSDGRCLWEHAGVPAGGCLGVPPLRGRPAGSAGLAWGVLARSALLTAPQVCDLHRTESFLARD